MKNRYKGIIDKCIITVIHKYTLVDKGGPQIAITRMCVIAINVKSETSLIIIASIVFESS